MKIIITEEQKKKLFIPRKIDERDEQLKGEIKKFLISIKDSFIWDFLGSVRASYDFESDYEHYDVFGLENTWISQTAIDNILNKNYSIEQKIEFNIISDKINDFIIGLLDNEGYTVLYGWGEITNKGNGKLEYRENRTRKIDDIDYRVVSI
jgi:hypothetical protein